MISFAFCLIPILKNLFHTGIAHAFIHIYHSFCNLVIDYISLHINGHDTAQCQPILACV